MKDFIFKNWFRLSTIILGFAFIYALGNMRINVVISDDSLESRLDGGLNLYIHDK
jgi:hypothetical protein